MDPPSMGKTLWTSADYTFNQYTDSGYSIGEFIVFYDPETDSYSPGTWSSGSQPVVEYKVTGDSDTLNPADFLDILLQDFGLSAADLDSTTWAAAKLVYTDWSLTWRGAFYQSEMRDTILNSLLSQCDSSLYISGKVELHPFSKTSQETFDKTKTKKLSFSATKAQQDYYDSGRVHWVESGTPQSELSGKALVPAVSGGPTDNPSGEVFQARFIESGVIAQKLGMLHFQRKKVIDQISFSTVGSKMSTLDSLKPGQVITVNDGLFSGAQDVIVTGLHIAADLEVGIDAVRFGELKEFYDVSATDISIGQMPIPAFSSTAKILQLRASGQMFHFDGAGDPDPLVQELTFKVYEQNLAAGNYVFTTLPNIKSQTSASNTFTLNNTEFGVQTSVKVTATKTNNAASLKDEVTVLRIMDGIDATELDQTLDIQSWIFNGVFAATNATTVTWTAPAGSANATIGFSGSAIAEGAEFTINNGSTGVMTEKVYIYFDQTTSEIDLLVTTTPSVAVGRNKVLIAIAWPGTSEANFHAFGQTKLSGIHLEADSVTGDKIVANTLDASHINVGTIAIGNLSGAGTLAGLSTIDYGTQVSGTKPPTDADKTSTHTAYDTSYVNGAAASTVENNAATGATHAGTAHAPSNADQTYTAINGGIISTGSIRNSANTMNINFGTATITVNAAAGLKVSSSGGIKIDSGGTIKFYSDSTLLGGITCYPTYMSISTQAAAYSGIIINAFGGDIRLGAGPGFNVTPYANDANSFGVSTKKWKEVWAVDGTINTSDAKEKSLIEPSNLGLDFITKLQPKSWTWNTGIRTHYGLVAQDVEAVMQADGFDFAGLIKNNLSKVSRDAEATSGKVQKGAIEKEEVLIETKNIKSTDQVVESFDSYGLRYHEFIGPMIKAIQELNSKIDAFHQPVTKETIK